MSDPVLEIFQEEAREHMGALEKLFLDLEVADSLDRRRHLIDNLFRHAHSLKGDARVVGLVDLQRTSQKLEDILDELRDKPETVDRAAVDRGLAQFDLVRQAFEVWQRAGRAEAQSPEGAGAGAIPASPSTLPPAQKEPEELQAGPVVESVAGKPEGEGVAALPLPSPLATEVVPPASPSSALPEESFTVRVPAERLDRMLNLAGEIRISQGSKGSLARRLDDLMTHLSRALNRVKRSERLARGLLAPGQSADGTHRFEGAGPEALKGDLASFRHDLEEALDQLRRLEGELHKKSSREELLVEALEAQVRQARLLPLVMLTDMLRRPIRDLAQSLGKAIRYEVQVGQVMLDKAVIEALKDPMLHLIRNAADHGVETGAERRAAGKPEEGLIRVEARQRGPLVRITVADDGRGVNFGRVRERVRQRADLSESEVAALDEPALAEYLFQPGFSTAPRGEVSGRGVGLDVVRTTLRKLQGNVELLSSSSAGTTFALTVPVTVSTIRILTVLSGGQYYGIPSNMVIRTGRVRAEDLRQLEGVPVLPVNGRPVRWVYLADLLGTRLPGLAQNGRPWPYLLVSHQGKELAVAVDDLEDESEVLLKPLGFPLAGMPGVVGAAIRADGSVQLVLDLSERTSSRTEGTRPAQADAPKGARRILVVDDSPTTRAVLRNVFTAAGYSVRTATDGVDALERLRAQAVDLVVSDVDMPRLNGFDLTRQIKARFGLPVVLVTGREKEEHRREGLEAGADAFVVKSTFQGEGLLQIVQQFV